jgi:hypothetical protein
MKEIREKCKVTVMDIFGELSFQHPDAFTQSSHLVSQGVIILSELFQLFVFDHAQST